MTEPVLLVAAGEASGDAMAAAVLARLGVPATGMGGPALGAHAELIVRYDRMAAMGLGPVLRMAPHLAAAFARLWAEARRFRPRAALLVGFSEFNLRLGRRLRTLGVRVLWYAPPQIWAWRPERGPRAVLACDAMAVVLPFELAPWQELGALAVYVGHPALELERPDRTLARHRMGLGPGDRLVAVLPGSRAHEVTRLLPTLLSAVQRLRQRQPCLQAHWFVAPSLPAEVISWAAEQARRAQVGVTAISVGLLPAADVALVCSGTATVECALCNVPPVVVYRTGAVAAAAARALVRVSMVGLPNLVLGERVFPELLQRAVSAPRVAECAERILQEPELHQRACQRVWHALAGPAGADREGTLRPDQLPSARVAALLAPWLS